MTSLLDWIKEHRIASVIILVILMIAISGIWWVRPAYFAATHTNMQDCGSVSRGGGSGLHVTGNSTPEQVIQCFVQAHQQCRAASIAYTSFGIDAGVTETFYTANSFGQCGLSLETDSYVISARNVTNDYTCSNMAQKADGLHFTCDSLGEQVFPGK
ncbi:MAG TPA: hypothetical protein VKX46_08920 [Ktedonobacteraceae bacterium]|jgi:hypothetical protein|nr:hypothetical protein [Ktedonobacteraceae bacterium]